MKKGILLKWKLASTPLGRNLPYLTNENKELTAVLAMAEKDNGIAFKFKLCLISCPSRTKIYWINCRPLQRILR